MYRLGIMGGCKDVCEKKNRCGAVPNGKKKIKCKRVMQRDKMGNAQYGVMGGGEMQRNEMEARICTYVYTTCAARWLSN